MVRAGLERRTRSCRSCQAKISDVSVFAQTESVPQRKSGVSQRFCAKVSSRGFESLRVFFFLSRVSFVCCLLFRHRFHPRVTARKRSRSFCQSAGGMHLTYVALHKVTWCMVVWCTQRCNSFMWHQPCQRCKYTTTVDIQKRAIKSFSLCSVASVVSLLESGE